MPGLLLVAIGGAFGCLTRYLIGVFINKHCKNKAYPYATFIINITGAIALGVLIRLELQSNIQLIFADGFLGAYTTFSTFMFEGIELIKGKKRLNAFLYILLSLLLGITGFYVGFILPG